MATFQRQYVLATTPLIQPLLPFPGPEPGVHVSYVEYFRRAVRPGEIEAEFLRAPTLSYQDGTTSLVGVPELQELPNGLGRSATIELAPSIDVGARFFTLLLPTVNPAAGGMQAITSVGISTRTTGPDTPGDPTQHQTYASLAMHGTFSEGMGADPPKPAARGRAAARRTAPARARSRA